MSVSKGWVTSNVTLEGKTALITGANSGIGKETTRELSKRGAKVIMACRDLASAEEVKKSIIEEFPNAKVEVGKLDLGSLKSVREFAKSVNENESRLDILINNAGVMCCPQGKTEDGFEMHLGINHIGHFLLTNLLLDLIKKSAPSRIICTASSGYKRGVMKWDDLMCDKEYVPFNVYANSKLANCLFAHELSRRLEGTGVTCNLIHPGLVLTNLGRHMYGEGQSIGKRILHAITWPIVLLVFKSPQRGAQSTIFCAVAEELKNTSGKYYNSDSEEEQLLDKALNEDDAQKLWKITEQLCGLNTDADTA
ncbi:retinol dehydrogenase 14 isoform X1 [Ciona intestinalis]